MLMQNARFYANYLLFFKHFGSIDRKLWLPLLCYLKMAAS